MARHRVLGGALLGAAILFPRPAHAQLELSWEAPPGCPQREEVFRRIGKVAGEALEATAGLAVEGSIAPQNGRYRLTLLVRSGDDVRQRVIASDSCADLAGAAAVTVALMLGVDPSTVGETDNTTGSDSTQSSDETKKNPADPRDEKKPVAPPPKQTPPPSSGENPAEWAAILRIPILSGDLGPLPRPAFGGGVGGGARYGAFRALITGRVSLRQTVDAPNSDGAFGAELNRWTAELDACYGFRADSFELAPCIAVALEHVSANGFGANVSSEKSGALWPAPGVGGVAHWYVLDSLALFTSVTGYVELSRPRLVIQGLGEIARLSPVAAGVTFGAEWIL